MYAWIWHKLPGTFAARLAQAVLLVVAVVLLLLFVIFPWASPHLPFNHVTVDTPPSEAPALPN